MCRACFCTVLPQLLGCRTAGSKPVVRDERCDEQALNDEMKEWQ
jgi:hypothetical protein